MFQKMTNNERHAQHLAALRFALDQINDPDDATDAGEEDGDQPIHRPTWWHPPGATFFFPSRARNSGSKISPQNRHLTAALAIFSPHMGQRLGIVIVVPGRRR